jgi:inner membrane protein
MIIEWWHWAVVGIGLVIVELLFPTMVLIWFGSGALLVALVRAVLPDISLTAQVMVWIVSSLAFVALWFKVFEPARHKILIGRSSAQVVGEVGLLVNDIDSFQKGRVRFQKPLVGSDVWDCIADEPITNGARVKVIKIEGSLLKVAKV